MLPYARLTREGESRSNADRIGEASGMRWICCAAIACVVGANVQAQLPFQLKPAVALEAEDFTVENGWKVVKDGGGNYMVDIIGFNHISGERLLSIDAKDTTARAYRDVTLPAAGAYRLWARYEYPAFCETRFRIVVEQGGKKVFDRIMGAKANPRYAFGEPLPKAAARSLLGTGRPDGGGGDDGALAAGKARIYLLAAEQPQKPGVAADRNIDLIYLTTDLKDEWRKHYAKQTNLYPILDAFRDTRGPRWQARVVNRGAKPITVRIGHVYNRLPWGLTDPADLRAPAGKVSEWVGLLGQDTSHFSMVAFTSPGNAFDVELRPVGGSEAVKAVSAPAGVARVYLPPYSARRRVADRRLRKRWRRSSLT